MLHNTFEKFLYYLRGMSLFPRTFYIVLLFLIANIGLYRIILFPGLLLILVTLFISEFIRVRFNDLLVRSLLKVNYDRGLFDILDPIAMLILLAETLLNLRFTRISPILLTFWTKPLAINYGMFTNNRFILFIVCFSKSLISLLIALLSLAALKYLGLSHFALALGPTPKLGLLQLFFSHLFVINTGLLIVNMVPLAPFEMGIALEQLGTNGIRRFVSATRPFGSLLVLIYYMMDIQFNFSLLHRSYNLLLNVLFKYV